MFVDFFPSLCLLCDILKKMLNFCDLLRLFLHRLEFKIRILGYESLHPDSNKLLWIKYLSSVHNTFGFSLMLILIPFNRDTMPRLGWPHHIEVTRIRWASLPNCSINLWQERNIHWKWQVPSELNAPAYRNDHRSWTKFNSRLLLEGDSKKTISRRQ